MNKHSFVIVIKSNIETIISHLTTFFLINVSYVILILYEKKFSNVFNRKK